MVAVGDSAVGHEGVSKGTGSILSVCWASRWPTTDDPNLVFQVEEADIEHGPTGYQPKNGDKADPLDLRELVTLCSRPVQESAAAVESSAASNATH